MKYVDTILIALSVSLAYGIAFYLYEPGVSEESRAWIEAAEQPSGEQRLANLEQLTAAYKALPNLRAGAPCSIQPLGADCYSTIAQLKTTGLDDRRRSIYRDYLGQLPFVPDANQFTQLPQYQLVITGAYDDFYQDLLSGGITEETIAFNLHESSRLLTEPGSLLEWMIAAAIFDIALQAANFELATGAVLDVSTMPAPWREMEQTLATLMKAEFAYSAAALNSPQFAGKHFHKQNWYLDDLRHYYTQHLEFLNQSPERYWREPLAIERAWYSGLFELDVNHNMLAYLDAGFGLEAKHTILLALANIYRGAEVQDHGVQAPPMRVWQWRENSEELCLLLNESVPDDARKSEATVCLPHLKRQLARLNSEET